MSMPTEQRFLDQSRFYLATEYRAKLRAAVEALPADALWWRANDQSNSVGNLLLHLAGNVREWIVSGIGGAPNVRHRAGEFAARSGQDGPALLEADAVLARVSPAALGAMRSIQGREVTVLDAVYHVVEHFSMHVGQIILIAKLHAPGALQFYEDAGGLARPTWRGAERTRA
jgi:uncharacterized damage-inducible protein DinB